MSDLAELSRINVGQGIRPVPVAGPARRAPIHRLKRGFDVTAALAALVVLLPVLALMWVLVRLDGGPGLFAHWRVGLGNRLFPCYKFRTMVTDADVVLRNLLARDEQARDEWNRYQKLQRDPRVTRVGRFLRATSLDELPQLFNVVRGDMSLVGPRPVVPEELDKFYVGEHRASYLSVRPGVTGLWQVSGRSDASYERRVALDSEYVRTVSLRRDLAILFRTVAVVLQRRGAY